MERPFRLTNAPATFKRLVEKIFFCKHSAYTGIFFYDIIHSHTLDERKRHLQFVFDELHANKLYVNGKKSELFMWEIRYLGDIISKKGIVMDLEKLRAIEEWPLNPRMCMSYKVSLVCVCTTDASLHTFLNDSGTIT